MSTPRTALRRICVVGAGQVAVLAAIGLKRAMPGSEVLVIGQPHSAADFADLASTALPFTNHLHDRLGLDEQALTLRAQASHRLVTRYFGWAGGDSYGVFAHGAGGEGGADLPTAGEQRAGSLAEALADAGRFAPPMTVQGAPLAGLDYALRWNPEAYRALLIGAAQRIGVAYNEGTIEGIVPDSAGGIAALNLAGHGTVEADLFCDCSGVSAALASVMPDYRWESWDNVLPPRRLLSARPAQGMVALEDRLTLLPEGWLSEIAGRDGLQAMLGAAPDIIEQQMLAALGAGPVSDVTLAAGRIAQAWQGNVITLGDAAARFEPLAGLPLDLAHRMIALLLEMLPGNPIEPLERDEFNRRAGLMMDGVRDCIALFRAGPAAKQLFGEIALPQSVAATIDQFTRRGRLPFQEEYPFAGQERHGLLRALGYTEGHPPQDRVGAAQRQQSAQQAFAAMAQQAVASAPPYAEWLRTQLTPSQ